ncbi:MAG: tetratricopeptide repeat protein, partial [Actinobacteria bacterium]
MIGLAASRAWRCGERLAAAGDHEGALAALREAASLAPGDPRIRLQEALALGELGRYD